MPIIKNWWSLFGGALRQAWGRLCPNLWSMIGSVVGSCQESCWVKCLQLNRRQTQKTSTLNFNTLPPAEMHLPPTPPPLSCCATTKGAQCSCSVLQTITYIVCVVHTHCSCFCNKHTWQSYSAGIDGGWAVKWMLRARGRTSKAKNSGEFEFRNPALGRFFTNVFMGRQKTFINFLWG